jgi:hypothetical protein
MSEEAAAVVAEAAPDNAAIVAAAVGDNTAPTDRPENVPEKFWDAENSSVRTDDVLKSYGELEKQFGSFTGAPDDYGFNVSDDMTVKFEELGLEISTEGDPLYEAAIQMAKDTGMNQEGFDKLAEVYLMTQLGDVEAAKANNAQEMANLGERAEARIGNLKSWGENNLSPELYQAFSDTVTNAASVQVFEHLIAQTRNAPVSDVAAQQAPSISATEVQAMQFAKDDNGNRRINTDPAFKADYQAKLRQLHGDGENRIMIG